MPKFGLAAVGKSPILRLDFADGRYGYPGNRSFGMASKEGRMPPELAFRARLIVEKQTRLYNYWLARAGTRLAPAPGDIDPVAIPDLLPGISILDVGRDPLQLCYRLAGTRLREIYGVELTGKRFFDLDLGDKRNYWLSAYGKIVNEATPMQGAVRAPLMARDHVVLFWLRLPLSDDGASVNRVLGFDIAVPATLAQASSGGVLSRTS